MNRWLMMVTIVFSFGIVAAAPAPEKKLPVRGDSVALKAKPASGPTIALLQPRLGDPDQPDFESGCQLAVPFEARVLGILRDPSAESTVVVEYHAAAGLSSYQCRDGAILLLSPGDWDNLKLAESALAKERTDQDRRREEIRTILRQNGRPNARQ